MGALAHSGSVDCPADQLHQPVDGLLAVLLLGAQLPGFDDQNPILVDALRRHAHQALAHLLGKRRRVGHVEAQLDGAGHLVYVLAPWA